MDDMEQPTTAQQTYPDADRERDVWRFALEQRMHAGDQAEFAIRAADTVLAGYRATFRSAS